MNHRNTRKLTRLKRIFQFCVEHLKSASHPAVTAEAAALATVITETEAAAVRQDGGAGKITSAVDHRLQIVKDLRLLMSSLAKAAKRLDPAIHPEAAGKMRMRGAKSFAQLLTRARLFAETLAPIKSAFVNLGAPVDVDVELADLIEALETAGDRKHSALNTQVNGTHSIEFKVRAGIRHAQQLDAIFTQLFRKDAVMLAQWNVVKRATPYPRQEAVPPANAETAIAPSAEVPAGAMLPAQPRNAGEVAEVSRPASRRNRVEVAQRQSGTAGRFFLPTRVTGSPCTQSRSDALKVDVDFSPQFGRIIADAA